MIDLVDNDPDDGTEIGNEKGHQPKVTNKSKKSWNKLIRHLIQKNYKLEFQNFNI